MVAIDSGVMTENVLHVAETGVSDLNVVAVNVMAGCTTTKSLFLAVAAPPVVHALILEQCDSASH